MNTVLRGRRTGSAHSSKSYATRVRRSCNAETSTNRQTGSVNPRSRYVSHRLYLVPADLRELTGPVTGVVELPVHLDWSEQRVYDLDDDAQLGLMYERVIREAVQLDDLRTYLNGSLLIRIWPQLFLPVRARKSWEARFRDLVRAA
ncbi:hypothetical protein ACTMTF_18565 [Nonomuraea sp. ZG12]|uniref:hypothetical protein n=1 Tax=Nonomuraea sp. ZG12 TaxID=3452207 RepID=UPI003F8B988B